MEQFALIPWPDWLKEKVAQEGKRMGYHCRQEEIGMTPTATKAFPAAARAGWLWRNLPQAGVGSLAVGFCSSRWE